jgi:Domain of Unknown Function (DUF1080)
MMKKLLPTLVLIVTMSACYVVRAGHDAPDADGFVTLFNGKDLTGWKGLDGLWSVKDGVIDGQEVKEHSRQTDLILADSIEHPEKYANFELHIKWQFLTKTGNSGIQYRSKINNEKELHCGGYQADIDSVGGYTGSIYDESGVAGGRGTMSNRGEKTVWTVQNKRENSPLAESGDDLKKFLHNSDGWNDVILRVQGNHTVYTINGHVMTDLTDNSPKAVADGVIGLQMHAGFTMHIQFKDVKIKFLDAK